MKIADLIPLCAALLTLNLSPVAIAAETRVGTPSQAVRDGKTSAGGLDLAGFDPSVRVQDDLFGAANGTWIRTTKMPADKAEYGSFIALRDLSDQRVRALVEELAANPAAQSASAQKVARFYAAYRDTAQIERVGLTSVRPLLEQVDALQSTGDLAKWMGQAQGKINTPIALGVEPDFKEPGIYRTITWQGGLGLPDRDYYLEDDEKLVMARRAYRKYLLALATMSGEKEPVNLVNRVMALELAIAKTHWDKVENRDPDKIYNPMTPAELLRLAPGFDWNAFFQSAGLTKIDRLSVSQPTMVTAFANLLERTPLRDWQAYLKLRVLDAAADVLPKRYRDAHFAFHGTALTGTARPMPRWQKAIAEVNGALGEAIGELYVARHFPPAHKARMIELVANLLAAYRESIDQLSWMDAQTKAAAQQKLAKYLVKIGYPDVWRDYSLLEARTGDALGNRMRAGRFEWERVARRVGQPVDRNEWGMTPQTVNAYYNATMNEIVFPAAILQPPFFDMAADDALNYGAIGGVIGHEISHGFDDEGSKFDGDGALRNWWTDADRKAFEMIGQRLVAQYEQYEPIPGKKLNGKLTLGENIADLAGLQIAFKAYQRSLGGKPAPVINGYTGEQRFFLGWSQAWREKVRESRTLQLLTIDPHSPPQFRANGAAINTDGYHDAFATRPGDRMFKPNEQRIRIW